MRPPHVSTRPLSTLSRLALGAATAALVAGLATPATAAPAAAQPVAARAVSTDAASATSTYVTAVYQDLFGRAPDPTGLATWTSALLGGTPRVAVANSITGSDEYRGRLITESYSTYLTRTPEAAGLGFWIRTLAGGFTLQQMEAGFLASDEYYLQSGSSPATWVTRLYQHVLGRTPDGSETAHWVGVMGAGTSRQDVAIGFLLSSEHLTSVVDSYYQHLLGRSIDASGRATWVNAVQQGTRVEEIIGSIVASAEYANANGGQVAAPAPAAPAPAAAQPAPGAPTTVGLPAGTPLRVHDGDLTITTPGTVVDGLDIRGYVRVKAPNVVIKNSIIRGRPGLTSYMSLVQSPYPDNNLLIQDTTLTAANPSPYVDGIVGKGFTLRRVDIYGVVDQVKITGDNVLVENSWLHDNLYYLQDPNYGYTPTHDDNVQIQAGRNITIRSSVLTSTHNAVMMITQDAGAVGNVTFTNNRVDNGACSINIAEKSYGPVSGVTIANNTFGLGMTRARCAVISPSTTASRLSLSGNVFTDGAAVTVSRG